jgi:DNA-binding SARP family transcriptional activator/tetratricopeptide (TPR) repeat protein
MRFRILGPLRVWDGHTWRAVGAAHQRAALALLLMEAGRVVATPRLIHEIWGEHPPRTAGRALHVYISRLRSLGLDDVLVTGRHGYELAVGVEDVDVKLFEDLVIEARRCLTRGDLQSAVAKLSDASALWQGEALADIPATATVEAEVARIEQLRLSAIEDRTGALLDLGRHVEVVDDLKRLAGAHPLRERIHAHLMLALHRCGHRAEALDAYQRARRWLVDELGLEPGAELQRLHHAVLVDEPIPAGSGSHIHRTVPAQLPPEVSSFIGRSAQLSRLDSLSGIAVITGPAGAGKTALAVHWAHGVRQRFPDGQLYLNLHGYAAASPVRPIEALAFFLRSLWVPTENIPTGVDEAAAMYRSQLVGKRMLVVLDNANHADQVRPLLPGEPDCLTLVTSRNQLRGLVARDGAGSIAVDTLTPVESQSLLTRLLGEQRAAAEPEALARLAGLCGHLPLALRIAAANMPPHQTIARHAEELCKADSLAALEVAGDSGAGVRTAFDHSYAALPPDEQRLFRWCGLVPGPDVTAEAAAALCDLSAAQATELLHRLLTAHLLEERSPDRYQMHDLLRVYAAQRAADEDGDADRDAALDRLITYYLHTTQAAAQLLYPHIVRVPSPTHGHVDRFTGHEAALAWLAAERLNLVAAVQHAPDRLAWRLADALRGYLHLNMYTADWQLVADSGLAAARADGDVPGLAAAHLNLALVHWTQGRHDQAVAHGTEALGLARASGWAEAEAAALNNLGGVHHTTGELEKCARYLSAALEIDERLGHEATLATKLGNLGIVYLGLGRLPEAQTHLTRALALNVRIGSVSGEARALCYLGETLHAQGRFDQALTVLNQARELHRTVSDRSAEANTMGLLAAVHRDLGDRRVALDLAEAVVTLARDAGNRSLEGYTLVTLGTVQPGRDHYGRALELAIELGEHHLEAAALIGRATEGDCAAAQAALVLARRYGYRIFEGNALCALGAIRLRGGAMRQAMAHARMAARIHTETGHDPGLAKAQALAEQAANEGCAAGLTVSPAT